MKLTKNQEDGFTFSYWKCKNLWFQQMPPDMYYFLSKEL